MRPSRSVQRPSRSSVSTASGAPVDLLRGGHPVAVVDDGEVPHPGAVEGRGATDPPGARTRRERGGGRRRTPRRRRRRRPDASARSCRGRGRGPRRSVCSPSSRCSSADCSAPAGWVPWVGLAQLLRVAAEDEVARCARHGDDVGERHLARLVDHQGVDGARHALVGRRATRCRRRSGRPRRARRRRACTPATTRHGVARAALVVVGLLHRVDLDAGAAAWRQTSSRRLPMARWLIAVIPTVRPSRRRGRGSSARRRRSSPIPAAPAPGGSRRRGPSARRRPASSAVSPRWRSGSPSR